MKHAPSHPTHPRFQAAALFHIVRLICLGCCETKNLFVKGCLFLQRLSIFSTGVFFNDFFCITWLSFFQRLSIVAAVLFFKGFLFLWPVCLFSQRLTIFSTLLFFKDSLFLLPVCLFSQRLTIFSTLLFFKGSPGIISLFLKEHLSFSQRLTFGPIFFCKD